VDREELMKGCDLVIEPIEAITFCEDCKQTYDTIKHGKICPHCGSGNTYLVTGNEYNIKEIEAC
jgi:hydrogenase nickel incorporation protein HypA/HybF